MYQPTKLSKFTEYGVVIASLLLTISLIFPIGIKKIPLILFFTITVIDIIVNRRWNNFKWDNRKLIFIAMIIYYLMGIVWHFLFDSNEINLFKHEIENRLAFIAFGAIGMIGFISPKLKPQYLANVMIITIISCTIWTLFKVFNDEIPVDSFYQYQQYFSFYCVNSHMVFNMYCNIAILLSIYSIFNSSNIRHRVLYTIALTIISIIVLTSEGRVGFLTVNLIFFGLVLYIIYKWKKWATIPTSIIVIACIIGISSQQHDLKNSDNDPRFYMWKNAWKTIKEQPILIGGGTNNARISYMKNCLSDQGYIDNYYDRLSLDLTNNINNQHRLHPHNVFFNTLLEFGLIGIFVLSFIFIFPIIYLKGQRRVYAAIFLGIMIIQSLFDVFSDIGLTPLIFCWFLTYLLLADIPNINSRSTKRS